MKSIKTIILLLFIITGHFTFGQLKVYNGVFVTANFQGNAIYNYNELPEKRVFNGEFGFISSTKAFSISGNYANDLKDGFWKVSLIDVANTNDLTKCLISGIVTGYFKEGNVDGDWNLSRTREVAFSNSGISIDYQNNLKLLSYLIKGNDLNTSKSTVVKEKSSASFKNNRFSGIFSYKVNDDKISVNGQFDDEGFFNGIWTVNYFQNEILHSQIRTYQKGVLETIKNKDFSTGEVTLSYDKSIEVMEFFQNFNSTENSSKKGNEFYKLVEGKDSNSDISILEDAISIWYNNKSLTESAYIFEIQRGSNEIVCYPERIIVLDDERTTKANEEEAIAKEKQENEKRQVEMVKERFEQEKKKNEGQKLKEFENSDYGKMQNTIKIEFKAWLEKTPTESDNQYENRIKSNAKIQFERIVNKVIKERKDKKYAPKVFGKVESYDANTESALIRLYGDYHRLYSNDSLYVKMSTGDASKVMDALRQCDVFCGIAVVCNKVALINSNFRLTEATILFVFGKISSSSIFGPYLPSLDFTLTKSGNKYILSSDFLDKDLQFDNLIGGADGKFLYYDWKLTDQSNYNPKLFQVQNFTIEGLNIEMPF